MFDVLDIHPENRLDFEQVGSKEKFWVVQDFGEGEVECLCKLPRWHAGEDWSEKIAAELCALLGLPHAQYSLGNYHDPAGETKRAIVSRRIDGDGERLVLGDELLADHIAAYERAPEDRDYYINPRYTVRTVRNVLSDGRLNVRLPDYWTPPKPIGTPFGVFVGYLLLDAWIGNTDRHDQNWAVVETRAKGKRKLYLAPTFDHASCLGRELEDRSKEQKLKQTDEAHSIVGYLRKCTSRFVAEPNSQEKLHVQDVFARAKTLDPKAGAFWIRRLRAVDNRTVRGLFDQVPTDRITDASVAFAMEILERNRNDLLS